MSGVKGRAHGTRQPLPHRNATDSFSARIRIHGEKSDPASITDLYRNRWSIEAFFKQIKQTLQLTDFLGHSANAVRWQVWTALLVYVLLRFLAFLHGWAHSFTRLFTVMRTSLWRRWDLPDLLRRYGTADGSIRFIATPQQPCFAGF